MNKKITSQLISLWSIPVTPIILIHLSIAACTAILLDQALFWDDWIVVGAPTDLNIERFTQAGTAFGWTGRLHSALSELNLIIYRLGLVAAWAVICATLGWIVYLQTKNWQVGALVATLAMIAPFNSAKFAIINTPAVLCVALFMIGWVVMRKSAALATIAFLASFTLPSLLFLYALPFAEHIGRLIKNKDRFSAHNLASTTYLATLPPLYWLAKSVWLEPHGIYQNYNQNISLQNAFSAIQITLTDIKYIAMNLEMGWYAGAIACIVALLPLSKQIIRWALSDQNSKPTWVLPLELAGTAALLLGIAPYLIAGHAPRWAVWDSRNQILIPFAFAILVTAVLTQLPKRISAATLATILGASIVYWSGQGYLLWRDWQKQIMIQRHWASDAKVAKADIVILDDQSSIGFANRRLPRFYELSGMLADAFGDEKRIGVEASQWIDAICNPNKNPMFRSKYYRTGDAKSSEGWDEHSWLIVRTTLSDKTPKPSKIHSLRYPTTNWLIASEPDQSMCIRSNPPHR